MNNAIFERYLRSRVVSFLGVLSLSLSLSQGARGLFSLSLWERVAKGRVRASGASPLRRLGIISNLTLLFDDILKSGEENRDAV